MDNLADPWYFHPCKLRNYKTRNLNHILKHVRQHRTQSKNHRFICDLHSPENYQCEKCHFQSDLKVLLSKHLDTEHKSKAREHYPTPDLRYCANCDFQTYSALILLNHHNFCYRDENISLENIKTQTEYDVCGTIQNVGTLLPDAKLKKAPGSQPKQKEIVRFLCDYCSYKSIRKTDLKTHIHLRHTPPEQINWLKCDHCSYTTVRKGDLKKHTRIMHTSSEQIDWLKCEHCSHKAKQKSNLEQHILARHPETVEPKKLKHFKCDHCSYKSIRKPHLKRHILLKHTPCEQIDWFKCERCSFKTKLKSHLGKHILSLHSETAAQLKKFKCDRCFYKTNQNGNLKRHILVKHTLSEQID